VQSDRPGTRTGQARPHHDEDASDPETDTRREPAADPGPAGPPDVDAPQGRQMVAMVFMEQLEQGGVHGMPHIGGASGHDARRLRCMTGRVRSAAPGRDTRTTREGVVSAGGPLQADGGLQRGQAVRNVDGPIRPASEMPHMALA
jgi:hypothetical protein